MVLFAQHDVIIDPPFTRLDILCCRNLLIYFNAALQRRLVPLFHYSLRPGGLLVLGGIGDRRPWRRRCSCPLHPKSRIYRRSDEATDARHGSTSPSIATGRRASPRRSRTVPQPSTRPPTCSRWPTTCCCSSSLRRRCWSTGGRHRLHQRSHGQIPRAGRGQGQLEHPRDGAARRSAHSWRWPCARPLETANSRSSCTACGSRTTRSGTLDVTVQRRPGAEPLAGHGDDRLSRRRRAPARKARGAGGPPAPVDPAISDELTRLQEEIHALRQEMRASRRNCRRPTKSCNPPTRSCSPPTRS